MYSLPRLRRALICWLPGLESHLAGFYHPDHSPDDDDDNEDDDDNDDDDENDDSDEDDDDGDGDDDNEDDDNEDYHYRHGDDFE